MVITWLDRVIDRPPSGSRPDVDPAPMQALTRQVAFERSAWTRERAARVTQLFDSMASGWNERNHLNRYEPLADALARGDTGNGRCLEVGSGTGLATPLLTARFAAVIGIDLARQMLLLASGPRIHADGARLPVVSGSMNAVVLVNALLFPDEVERVLRPGGTVVWVNTLGNQTPIHMPPEDVSDALGGWPGVAAEAGNGLWAVLRHS